MKQLKASVGDELAERLERASTKSGRSLSAEIAHRLEVSFTPADKPSADFLQGVALMLAEIERETGAAWHEHAGAHEVLTRAIQLRLNELKPKSSTAFKDRPHATIASDDPYQLASQIEFRLRRQPDFTTSGTRKLLEEEHQRSRPEMMGSPRALLDTPQQQRKPDQPKKRGK